MGHHAAIFRHLLQPFSILVVKHCETFLVKHFWFPESVGTGILVASGLNQ